MNQDLMTFQCIGVEATSLEALRAAIPTCDLKDSPYDMSFFEKPAEKRPVAILCGMPSEEMQPVEVAQALRMIYPSMPIFFLSVQRATFNRKALQKNGFTDAFLLPTDQPVLTETIQRMLAQAGSLKVYRNVRLIDIPSDDVLGFDLYLHLPANNKYIRYAGANDVLNAERLTRLNERQVTTASVTEDQMSKFYEFAALQLKKLGSSSTISETQKRELREGAVRDLFTGIFGEGNKEDTIQNGREVMADCQQIIKSYIMTENGPSKWLDKMMSIASTTNNTYNHAANVSTYAALFSIGLGIGKADELALAGLLHDIGLADIPPDISGKNEADRTPEEQLIYQKHPHLSVSMMREKKLIVPERVMKIISQHHERFDGKGYPDQVSGTKFVEDAQLLALADLFDYMTKIIPGQPRVTPIEAMEKIRLMNSSKEGEMLFDPNIIEKVVGLFGVQQRQAA